MTEKRAFLLARARKSIALQDIRNDYDDVEQLNLRGPRGDSQPLVMDTAFGYTESKTYAAPGDDDPDRESEGCY